ncbi:PAC2 family protein [Demequina sp. B12]|uniref:PAC2 family protein n=1 Tax=Demequina sp. B12 TaxID=2992757 RepID=UPI00237C3514|nr:PAC2 family protein [Demequina sp. B12]MDE0573344.1 PAC2 family protein [Demequina sp. B12]
MSSALVNWDPDGVEEWERVAPADSAVLMHSLRGFIDAGKTGALVAGQVVEASDPVRLATFDIDQLLDYRSRRPEMTFSVNEFTDYDEPHLQVDIVRDLEDTPFLFLHGFEPDIRWEAYIAAVREIVDRTHVGLTLGAHGIPMAAPHTRPLGVTVHGTPQELLPDAASFFGTAAVPASAQNLLEYRFGQWGLAAINVAVHVPHYLAQSSYPQAAKRAIRAIEDISGLLLDTDGLEDEAARAEEEIARQSGESEEVQALVTALEEQYDAFMERREDGIESAGPLPSAEELGAEFERFLQQQRGDTPPGA